MFQNSIQLCMILYTMDSSISVESDSQTVQCPDIDYCKSRNHSICSTHSMSSMSSTESKHNKTQSDLGKKYKIKSSKNHSAEHAFCKLQWKDKTRTYSYDSAGSTPSAKSTPRIHMIHRSTSTQLIRKRDITVDEMEERIPTPQPLRFMSNIRKIDSNAWGCGISSTQHK